MILTNHFSPTSHPCVVGPYDKSITYVIGLRFAIYRLPGNLLLIPLESVPGENIVPVS